MGEIGDHAVLHLEIDRHGRAAELGVRGRGGIGMLKPAYMCNISGETENFRIVDVIDHDFSNRRRF